FHGVHMENFALHALDDRQVLETPSAEIVSCQRLGPTVHAIEIELELIVLGSWVRPRLIANGFDMRPTVQSTLLTAETPEVDDVPRAKGRSVSLVEKPILGLAIAEFRSFALEVVALGLHDEVISWAFLLTLGRIHLDHVFHFLAI